jgi:flagellar protein FlbD
MIRLHRLGSSYEPFHVNPDLIATVEGHPDVVLTLTNGTKIVVAETDDEVVAAVRRWRIDVMTEALQAADINPRAY